MRAAHRRGVVLAVCLTAFSLVALMTLRFRASSTASLASAEPSAGPSAAGALGSAPISIAQASESNAPQSVAEPTRSAARERIAEDETRGERQVLVERRSILEEKAARNGWEALYAGQSVEALAEHRRFIESVIVEKTKDEFERRFASGEYEVLSYSAKYVPQSFDPLAVYWIRILPGGPVMKATLPEGEFPEIYDFKAESAWLAQTIVQGGGAL